MAVEEKLRYLLVLELFLLAAIAGGVLLLPTELAESYLLFELMGALLAASITTFGLRQMKSRT